MRVRWARSVLACSIVAANVRVDRGKRFQFWVVGERDLQTKFLLEDGNQCDGSERIPGAQRFRAGGANFFWRQVRKDRRKAPHQTCIQIRHARPHSCASRDGTKEGISPGKSFARDWRLAPAARRTSWR